MKSAQRWPIIMASVVCAMGLTAGMTDMMVSAANQDSASAAAAAQSNDYMDNAQPIPQQFPLNTAFGCLPGKHGKIDFQISIGGQPLETINQYSTQAACEAQLNADTSTETP